MKRRRLLFVCALLLAALPFSATAQKAPFRMVAERTLEMKGVVGMSARRISGGATLLTYETADGKTHMEGLTPEGERLFCVSPEEFEAETGVLLESGEDYVFCVGDYLVTYKASETEMTTMGIAHVPSGRSAGYSLRYESDDIHFAEADGRLLVISQDEKGRRIFRFFDQDCRLVDQGFAPDIGGAGTSFVVDRGDVLACFAMSGYPEYYMVDCFDKQTGAFTDDRITFSSDEERTLSAALACGRGYLLLFKEDLFAGNDGGVVRVTDLAYLDERGDRIPLDLPDKPIVCAMPQIHPNQFSLIQEDLSSGSYCLTTYQADE